ncbi:hypothetical protein SERLA73DRAFT_77983 [Serpula lacrymans var. lacrymans S7.3]|uniref:Uncharacterized protein n=2 Tax=Serpula lacrymans var. lacrymans TaxID=341189 RepID=F8QBS9_SERL3|nr:uncharacterized protein SERLADRAFT_411484 [Serpula lacrymans var. lacrymans S7.9]EGN94048.1 hypothetical protein SERLA73DRAFT_77983 [Serpula lacrymans var. lacrymans S7.3]EGO19401.1 hypothetical protein SERLADRAFT_411484 [Serpula lacrymans var. lacrymans S7.9]
MEITMNGNNSAKFVDPAFCRGCERPEPRDGKSTVWISEEYVNQFKNEVQSLQQQPQADNADPDDPWIDDHEAADPTQDQNALLHSLGPMVKKLGVDGVVPTFHGYAHNQLCQVQYHSKYKVGPGKEDFETCKQILSGSNTLAPEIRNSTEFHWH